MKVGLAQINTTVGDLTGNAEKILEAYRLLVAQGADLVLTPELALTGYPPQDLLFAGGFVTRNLAALAALEKEIGSVPLIVGFVDENTSGHGKPFHNAAAVLMKGTPRVVAFKRLLPTYDVFDEARYFEPGVTSTLIAVAGKQVGITICEDLWTREYLPGSLYHADPPAELLEGKAEVLINLSASPYQLGKPASRRKMLRAQAKRLNVPIVYCNSVGGNDQLVFDGHSLVVAVGGGVWRELAGCREENALVDLSGLTAGKSAENEEPDRSSEEELRELHDALVLGVRDYLQKCGFQSAVIGLSGGIDSALIASLAVEALGADQVTGVAMPGPYSSEGSLRDAEALAGNLGIKCLHLPITTLYEEMKKVLHDVFLGRIEDATEENMQARLRGVTLMALSNKFGSLLLTTGNKSELAVGYCTLYGDMCGGLAAISDLPKTLVYRLARWINRVKGKEIIPKDTLEKPPSAELRLDQKDEDSLPPYELLDAVLQLYVEENLPVAEIVSRGFDEATVRWIARQVDRNEYKREQAAPGLKVTARAFGSGRRLPIAQRYKL